MALTDKALQSPRHDILLFLLVQVAITLCPAEHVAAANPWTEYVKMLDDDVPVPTLWTEHERLLLQGTSLEVCQFSPSQLNIFELWADHFSARLGSKNARSHS